MPAFGAQTITGRPADVPNVNATPFIFENDGLVVCQITPGYYFIFETRTNESFLANGDEKLKARIDAAPKQPYAKSIAGKIGAQLDKLLRQLSDVPREPEPAVRAQVISQGETPIADAVLRMFQAAEKLGYPCHLPLKTLPGEVLIKSASGERRVIFEQSAEAPELPWQNLGDLKTVEMDTLERTLSIVPQPPQ